MKVRISVGTCERTLVSVWGTNNRAETDRSSKTVRLFKFVAGKRVGSISVLNSRSLLNEGMWFRCLNSPPRLWRRKDYLIMDPIGLPGSSLLLSGNKLWRGLECGIPTELKVHPLRIQTGAFQCTREEWKRIGYNEKSFPGIVRMVL